MAREFYENTNFRPGSMARIHTCNDIIAEYLDDGLRLTLRQLYYQLVSRAIIPNTERSYKNLGGLLSKARLAGFVDWDAIEDRTRQPVEWNQHDNLRSAVNEMLRHYRLPRLQGQENYVELWVEKDALAGVLSPIAAQYHVTLMVNRGYSSSSAMYEAAKRIDGCVEEYGSSSAVVLYLGDLDPSGEDMVRDIKDRLNLFADSIVNVAKLALTMDQVEQHSPPPNPTKLTDSRAREFIAKYGYESWEVDALPPKELRRIIESAMDDHLDFDLIEEVKKREQHDIMCMRAALE